MMLSPFSVILCAGAIVFGGLAAGLLLGTAVVIELALAAGRVRE